MPNELVVKGNQPDLSAVLAGNATPAIRNRVEKSLSSVAGNSILDYRDRPILKFFLYSGARLSTACRLKVSAFHQDGDEAIIRSTRRATRVAPSACISGRRS